MASMLPTNALNHPALFLLDRHSRAGCHFASRARRQSGRGRRPCPGAPTPPAADPISSRGGTWHAGARTPPDGGVFSIQPDGVFDVGTIFRPSRIV